jgi:putative ABC transport system ATP-binding protein
LAKPTGTTSSVIVLADEPTGDLDTLTGADVMKVLIGLTKGEGGTLIVVTHDPDVGKQMDRIYNMRDGRILDEKQR